MSRSRALVVSVVMLAAGCAPSLGRPFAPATFDREPGWQAARGVPLVLQRGELDCGAAAAAMVLGFWRVPATPEELRAASGVQADRGLTARWLRDALRVRGLQAYLVEGTFEDLAHELDAGRPVLVGVVRDRVAHYQLVIGLHRARGRVVVLDPSAGWLEVGLADFDRRWSPARRLAIVSFAQPAGEAAAVRGAGSVPAR